MKVSIASINHFSEATRPQLINEKVIERDTPLSEQEFILALSSMDNEKCPDNDGLTKVLPVFHILYKSTLYCTLHYNSNYFVKKDWSPSQKQSVIKLPRKKDEDKTDTKLNTNIST